MDSILSTGEREVAALLAEGLDEAEIAAERDVPDDQVELAVDRVREKTRRAYATLAASPVADEVAGELDEPTRRAVRRALAAGGEGAG